MPPRTARGTFLLLDEHVVDEAAGCRLVFHSPIKDPANPIITKTEPWEGRGPYTWGTRLLWNPDTAQYDFQYVAFDAENDGYRCGLAVSEDGINWRKPELNLETHDGRPARNMLPCGESPMDCKAVQTRRPHRLILRDPRPDCPPHERYKAIYFTYFGECVAFSPDGRRDWREEPANPVWHVPSDVIHAMWDPVRGRFAAYYKVWEVTGEARDSSAPGGWRSVTAHMPAFEHRLRDDGLTELWGPRVLWHPDGIAEIKEDRFLLRTAGQGVNDGGGAPLTGAWHSRRVIAWAESEDWRRWQHEQVVLQCDERDRPDANIQHAFVTHYGNYYLGFLTVHDERGHFEQQFAFSRDGIRWSRPWRRNFLGLGATGEFDCGMVLGLTDPVLTNSQMLFYYGGFDILHYEDPRKPWSSAIGRAALRRDGFASWENTEGQAGSLTTRPLLLGRDPLWVNADAQGGRLRVAVLEPDGRALPGLDLSSSVPLSEDTAGSPDCRQRMSWRSGAALPSREVRLRFHLDDARLFSFGAALESQGAIPVGDHS